MRKPNFFIVGTSRAGTSTLWQYLKLHPQIFMPQSDLFKEPAYFCKNCGMSDFSQYLGLFKEAKVSHLRIGEASTAYINNPATPDLICRYATTHNLDIKIIICLRNPVDRAYSLYNWNVQAGYEPAGSFEKALQLEEIRKKRSSGPIFNRRYFLPQYLYFETGMYTERVARFLNQFGKENTKIIIFEDMVRNVNLTLNMIYHFLGLQTSCSIQEEICSNPSVDIISPKLQVLLRQFTRLLIHWRIIKNYSTISERDFIVRLGKLRQKTPPLDKLTRQYLERKYYRDVRNLENMLQINLKDIWF